MYRPISLLFVFLLFLFSSNAQYTERNLLSHEVTPDRVDEMVHNLPQWRNHTKTEILHRLQELPKKSKSKLIHTGEKYLDYTWPTLPAWNYLDFVRNGNRTVFQSKWSERRNILNELTAAELIEGKGRFIPQIVNGIWALCEESTWCYPAHISAQGKSGLPDPNQNIIDLGAGETALNISWVYAMLKDSLKKISPVIPERIKYELNKRIIQPYMSVNFWWMGFPSRKVNNWNIWINRNCLYTIALTGDDDDISNKFINRLLNSADHFINSYGDDGGCEEGTHYWEAAPGYMIQLIGLVKELSQGAIDISQNGLIKKMGHYIYNLHIDKDYYVDFADASPTPRLLPLVIYDYGKTIDDTAMMQFASYLADQQNYKRSVGRSNHLYRFFSDLLLRKDILNTPAKAPFIQSYWYPDLQLMTQRDYDDRADGLFLAAIGSNNGVSHSHNDVGNFIVYVDGQPAIVDAGVGTYTAQTFGSGRYDIWTMQSAWHNLPTINGVQQKNGSKFKAEQVRYSKGENKTVLQIDIAAAYPPEAKVNTWQRTLTFNRNKNIVLHEQYALGEYVSPSELSLLTPLDVVVNDGELLLKSASGEKNVYGLKLKYDPKKFSVKVEKKEMDDATLKRLWPHNLNRILLISKTKQTKGSYDVVMSKIADR